MGAVFLFDGDCGFCTATAAWQRRLAPSAVAVQPWQEHQIAALGLTRDDVDASVWYVAGSTRLAGPDAIAAYLQTSTPVWRVIGTVLALPAVNRGAWPVYRFVARHRGRLPGATPACVVDPPSHPVPTAPTE